jgi:FkbM family methyltransferase
MFDNIEIRDVEVEGETNWYWIKSDQNCFEGTIEHWNNHHSKKYFKHVKNYDTVVTGGTNCGMYARLYAKRFKHVYAFEPEPIAFTCMVNNNPYDHVIKLNCAIGHGNGIVGLYRVPQDNPGSDNLNIGMNILQPPSEQFQIPMLAIDSLNLMNCDLIALDTEGFEMQAIEGARNTIEKFHPTIIAERFNTPDHVKFMKSLGYEYVEQSFLDSIYVYNQSTSTFSYKVG